MNPTLAALLGPGGLAGLTSAIGGAVNGTVSPAASIALAGSAAVPAANSATATAAASPWYKQPLILGVAAIGILALLIGLARR